MCAFTTLRECEYYETGCKEDDTRSFVDLHQGSSHLTINSSTSDQFMTLAIAEQMHYHTTYPSVCMLALDPRIKHVHAFWRIFTAALRSVPILVEILWLGLQ